ncbi:DUF4384 domain-containing protein [Deinococcus peraridilitoris]|uniref:PEGA domain-containing protein n=1 Tax=Deinococcus peraridilitoris (strain DSM 19664 / LMG 22246 / CIP 109416 / KR-200) TaxID=937777 RepID=K9ZYE0_DEIPD|nr:DUF4384 domain-containing protein [Deinococcus peraridilitoris]AFZ66591.1 PEGA domain-containing protein [Deinococcus peraridilitoris DSM 19664]
MKNLLTLSALALVSGAIAQPRISPQSIIVNPTPTELSVRVWTNKDTSGNQTPDYRVGEKITLFTTVNQDAYVYLFNVNPDGSIDQILPNRYQSGQNFLRGGTTKQFPAQGDNFTFDISGQAGLNKVLALASKTQLNLDQISQFRADQQNQGFATVTVRGQDNFARALSIVVNPVPQNAWTTDVALYSTVTGQAQAPARGGVNVASNVQGTVFLNDREVGQTGSTFANITPGTYRVRVSAPGYADYTTTVTVRAGATLNVSAALQAEKVPLRIVSNVENARIFVDGREAGTIRDRDLTVNLERGDYEITVIAPGHRASVQTVQVRNAGNLTVNLSRVR